MTVFGHFVWGTLSAWAWRKHMLKEIIPYAKSRGYSRAQARKAVIEQSVQGFDDLWPEDRT